MSARVYQFVRPAEDVTARARRIVAQIRKETAPRVALFRARVWARYHRFHVALVVAAALVSWWTLR